MSEQTQTETANGSAPRVEVSEFLDKEPPEVAEAKQLAKRYRLPFIGLFLPGARFGVLGVAIVFYLVIIFAGVAIPAFVKAKEQAKAMIEAQQQKLKVPQDSEEEATESPSATP